MTPMQIIHSATLNSAELSGMHDRIGSLEAGRFADVIGVMPFIQRGRIRWRTPLARVTIGVRDTIPSASNVLLCKRIAVRAVDAAAVGRFERHSRMQRADAD